MSSKRLDVSAQSVSTLEQPFASFSCGRLPLVTNVCFVEAKPEARWFAVRLLWSNPEVGFGSKSADEAIKGELPLSVLSRPQSPDLGFAVLASMRRDSADVRARRNPRKQSA